MDKCPHCNGLLFFDYDEWGKYILCSTCAREYGLDFTPRRMTPEEFVVRTRIKLTDMTQSGIIKL